MDNGASLFTGFIIGAVSGIITLSLILSKDPTPMDVYRGNTTLEYVVVDGQATDSTVIWKKDIQDKQ